MTSLSSINETWHFVPMWRSWIMHALAPVCSRAWRAAGRKQALAEFDAVVSAREIMPKWKTLQEAVLPVIDCYRTFYRTELQSCVTAIAGLKREIEDAYAFTRLEESRRPLLLSTHFGSASPLAVAANVSLETPADLLRSVRTSEDQ